MTNAVVTKTTETLMGTCPICTREIAIQNGILVHHGFRRPGDGQIHGDCFGVGFVPYETGTDACKAYRAMKARDSINIRAVLRDYRTGAIVTMTREVSSFISGKGYVSTMQQLAVGVTELSVWERQMTAVMARLEDELAQAQAEVIRMDTLVREWAPATLTTETRVGRQEREQAAAAKAGRQAKAQAKQAAQQAKDAAKRARLIACHVILADLAAAIEKCTVGNAVVARLAQARKELKGPKVGVNIMDLPLLFPVCGPALEKAGVMRLDTDGCYRPVFGAPGTEDLYPGSQLTLRWNGPIYGICKKFN